jgi:FkbM family methyltransferase
MTPDAGRASRTLGGVAAARVRGLIRHRRRPAGTSAVPREKAERARRDAFFREARALTPYVAVRVGEELFFLSTDDPGISRNVFARAGRKDIAVLERAVAWLAENGVPHPAQPQLVDVGANIGTTTVIGLRRHGFATGVALEPSPENYRVLRLNLVANGLDSRVQPLPVAASDREGRLRLDVSRRNKGGHRVVGEGAAASPEGEVTVQAVTLDALVADGVVRPGQAGLVWIDAPGHEARIITGAGTLLDRGIPLVMAIRPVKGPEKEARPWDVPPAARGPAIAALGEAYTHVVELRKKSKQGRRSHPIDALPAVVDSFRHCQDLLFVRRDAGGAAR